MPANHVDREIRSMSSMLRQLRESLAFPDPEVAKAVARAIVFTSRPYSSITAAYITISAALYATNSGEDPTPTINALFGPRFLHLRDADAHNMSVLLDCALSEPGLTSDSVIIHVVPGATQFRECRQALHGNLLQFIAEGRSDPDKVNRFRDEFEGILYKGLIDVAFTSELLRATCDDDRALVMIA